VEEFPVDALTETNRSFALLFKNLATLRTDISLFKSVNELRWKGPTATFASVTRAIDDTRLMSRVSKIKLP
jgi:hypothetical protein